MSCGLSLVLILSVITSNSIVLPLLQFCCSKILNIFCLLQRFEESHAWFLVCVTLFLGRLQKVTNEHIVIKLKFA